MEGTVKIDIFRLTGPLQENYPTGLLAGGTNAPYERFAASKTSADCARRRVSERNRRSAAALGAEMAEFTSAEH